MNDPLNPQSNESQRRLMVALALSFAVVTAWQLWFAPKQAAQDAAKPAAVSADAGTATAPAPAPAPGAAPGLQAASADAPPARTLERTRPTAHYRFSSEGAGLTFAQL